MSDYFEMLANVKHLLEDKGVYLSWPHLERYVETYASGKMRPHFPVPSTIIYKAEDYFAAYYALELLKIIFSEEIEAIT